MRHTAILALALACGSTEAERSLREPPAPTPPAGVAAELALEYARPDGRPLLLDFYRPEGPGALPLLVYVFGGGWKAGHRHSVGFARGPLDLTRHGYAVAAIDYRLSDRAIFPAQIRDVKAALCWLRIHASERGIDPDRIGIWGVSAGGHLAALAGVSGGAPELEPPVCSDAGPLGSRVRAVVDFFGPTDLVALSASTAPGAVDWSAADSPVRLLLGGPVETKLDLAALANPIGWIQASAAAFLVVHGDHDNVVPISQSELLVAALVATGVEASLYVVAEGGHHRGGEFGTRALFERVREFLDAHLK